jgi:RNA polymerase sigma factor (sigma-70 family)
VNPLFAAPILHHVRRLAAGESCNEGDQACLERFVTAGDGRAFETLVRRHGPMVLRLCRTIVNDAHASEDAFQATFRVLARQAAAVRKHRSLASWLYKVAYRIALRARPRPTVPADSKARPVRRAASDPADDVSWREVQTIFIEELARLPDHYRGPLLLCYWEGLTRDEAAARLGCKPGTLKSRLERGRRLLRARLERRGVGLSAGLLAFEVCRSKAPAAGLEAGTAAAGMAVAARGAGQNAGGVPETVVRLAEHGLRAALPSSLQAMSGRLLALGVLLIGGGFLLHRLVAAPPPAERPVQVVSRESDRDESRSANADTRTDADGDPLPPDAVWRLGTLRLRHSRFVDFVRYTPDGKTLVSKGEDGVRTWDATTGKMLHAFPPEKTLWGGRALLSPDGRQFATASKSGVHVWDVSTGKLVRTIGNGGYFDIRWSPDGKWIAAIADRPARPVEVWDVQANRRLWHRYDPSRVPMSCMTFTPDGKSLIVGGWAMLQMPPRDDHRIVFLDATTGAEHRCMDMGTRNPERMAVSPDGTRLIAICWGMKAYERGVLGWDLASGRETLRIDPPQNEFAPDQAYISAFTFTPSGNSLLTAGGCNGLIEWDLATGKELRRLGSGVMNASDLAFSPDGRTVVVAGAGSSLRLLDAASGKEKVLGPGSASQVNEVAISRDGKTVVAATANADLLFWDVATGQFRKKLEPEEKGYWNYVLADNGRLAFATKTWSNVLRILDLPSGKERARVLLDFAGTHPVPQAASAAATLIAVKDYFADTIYLVDVAAGRCCGRLTDPGFKSCQINFTADGRTLFVFCANHTTQVWDSTRKVKLRQFGPRGDTSYLIPLCNAGQECEGYKAVASPDGSRVAYQNRHGYLALFDAGTGKELWRLGGIHANSSLISFSPAGHVLTIWDATRRAVCLIETASGKERRALTGHRGEVYGLGFSADGATLVSGSSDTTAIVWDLTGRRSAGKSWDKAPSPAELETCWQALAGEDAAKAYSALQRLTASPRQALPMLARWLRPVTLPGAGRVDLLIADLDSDRFAARDAATKELEKLGDAALPACRKALTANLGAEARRRLQAIVDRRADQRKNPSGDDLRIIRALELLELVGNPQACEILESLARGLPRAALTDEAKASLARLAQRTATAP